MIQRLDGRSKLLGTLAAIAITSTVPSQEPLRLAPFFVVTLILLIVARVPLSFLTSRALAAFPLILIATLSSAFGWSGHLAVGVTMKAMIAVGLSTVLTSTTTLPELIHAIRQMRAPDALSLSAVLSLRYIALIEEEYFRMSRARDSRAVILRPWNRFRAWGSLLGLMLVRAWERADRVHAAMVSRGFSGSFPMLHQSRLSSADTAFLLGVTAAFVLLRLLPWP